MVSAGVVLLANMLDTTIKKEEDIEKISKLMILSSRPNYENEMKIKKGARR